MKISSEKQKILIVSDVHQDINRLDKIIKAEDADINVCLGDWFDSFIYDDTSDFIRTAEYLKTFLNSSKNITLWGNHDTHYLSKNQYTICSGYTTHKAKLSNECFGTDKSYIADKFKWYIWIDGKLCTHAGLHPKLIRSVCKNNDDIDKYLSEESEAANRCLKTNQKHWFYLAGRSRGGPERYGGITWLDFDQEYDPIDDLQQIVGHTHRKSKKIQCHRSEGSINPLDADNICIDTNMNEYLTVLNGKWEIKTILGL